MDKDLLQATKIAYLHLQQIAHHPFNVEIAVRTDGTRAILRDAIAAAEKRTAREVQEENESLALELSKK